MKRADAEAIMIKGTTREEKATIERADAEAIMIRGSMREENGVIRESGC